MAGPILGAAGGTCRHLDRKSGELEGGGMVAGGRQDQYEGGADADEEDEDFYNRSDHYMRTAI